MKRPVNFVAFLRSRRNRVAFQKRIANTTNVERAPWSWTVVLGVTPNLIGGGANAE
jgi:hypothetical protein